MTALKSRKARALLAGGVVLGVGAGMTLAAWSDSEWVTGTFSTSGFSFQGSNDGADFDDHPAEDAPNTLTFTASADSLVPGETITAPYWVRVTNGPAATVTLQTPNLTAADALAANINTEVTLGECNTTGGTVIQTGPLTAPTGSGAVGTVGEAPVAVCFKMTLDEDYEADEEATTGPVTWEFAATTATTP